MSPRLTIGERFMGDRLPSMWIPLTLFTVGFRTEGPRFSCSLSVALTSDDRPATMPPEIWKICDRCCRATPTTSFEEIEASLCTFENQEPVTDEKEWSKLAIHYSIH